MKDNNPQFVKDKVKRIFERNQMEDARKKFLANPYKGTEIEIQHGKEKEWIQEELMENTIK